MNLGEHLRKLEESLLSSVVRKDHDYVATLLADDFREFGSSGRSFTKTAILAELQAELALSDITLNDFVCSFLAEGVAFLTYRTVRTMPTDICS